MERLIALADKAIRAATSFDWLALLVARLTVGVLFVSTGWGKVHSLDKVTAYFVELKIPMPGLNAVVASFTELVGGALLVVGLGSRLASVPLIVTMIVALVTAKRAEIHGLADLFGEVEWTYIALLFVILIVGPGKASLDGLIAKRRRTTAASSSAGGGRAPTRG
jgi:putative oxidoreductase